MQIFMALIVKKPSSSSNSEKSLKHASDLFEIQCVKIASRKKRSKNLFLKLNFIEILQQQWQATKKDVQNNYSSTFTFLSNDSLASYNFLTDNLLYRINLSLISFLLRFLSIFGDVLCLA